jgi:hypothetical protein
MYARRFDRIAGFLIILFAALLLATPSIRAGEGTTPASVTIAEPITVTGVDPLDFGDLTAPTTSVSTWTVSSLDGTMSQTGDLTSTDLYANDHNRGSFQILGTPFLTVNFTVTVSTDFADPNLSLTAVEVYPSSPQSLPDNGGVGLLDVQVGGQLSINPGVAAGVHNDAVITMVANY